MSETIKMHGRLLLFDIVDECNWMIPKDCKIEYPEKVPFLNRITDYNNASAVVGNATIYKDDLGLVCDVNLYETLNDGNLHIGGIFRNSVFHGDNGIRVFDEINIYGIGIIYNPANEEYKLNVVEEREE